MFEFYIKLIPFVNFFNDILFYLKCYFSKSSSILLIQVDIFQLK